MAKIDRKAYILAALQFGPATAYQLANELDCPEASIRRTIQQLRADGHNVAFAEFGGPYRLGSPISSTPVPVAESVEETRASVTD